MDARIELVTPAGAGCNTWLIGDDEEVIVIDPGQDADAVLAAAGEREILAVICTHGHAAHVEAAVRVAERDEAATAVHRRDLLLWREVHPDLDPDIEMDEGGRFEVSDVSLEVLHTPGHSAGSVSLLCDDLDAVFTGDALSADGPVPHDGEFPDFAVQMGAIGEELLTLPRGMRVLPGHGAQTTVAEVERRFDGWVTSGPALADLPD